MFAVSFEVDILLGSETRPNTPWHTCYSLTRMCFFSAERCMKSNSLFRAMQNLRDVTVGSVVRLNSSRNVHDPLEMMPHFAMNATDEQKLERYD
jgi:hypothetical protein